MISTVQVNPRIVSPDGGFKNRIYYPVKNLRGPEYRICKDYTEFMTYYGRDKLAQLLYESGYQLLCHRSSYVYSKANISKYYINGQYQQYQDFSTDSSVEDQEYIELYTPDSEFYKPTDSKYSFRVKFNTKAKNLNDFYLTVSYDNVRVSSLSSNNSSRRVIGLYGSDYIKLQGKGDWDKGKKKIKDDTKLMPSEGYSVFLPEYEIQESGYTNKKFNNMYELEPVIVDFLHNNCNIDVLDLGYHNYIFSTNSVNFEFNYYDYDIFEEVTLSDYYYHRSNSTRNVSNKVLSITSKYPCAYSDINVIISPLPSNLYKISVYSQELGSESFTSNINDIITYGLKSNIIDLELYNTTDYNLHSITGTYQLLGSNGYYNEDYHISLLRSMNLVEGDVPQVDIVIDSMGTDESASILNSLFPWALIVDTNLESYHRQLDGTVSKANLLSITPDKIHYVDRDLTAPSYYALLTMLPDMAKYTHSEYIIPEDSVKAVKASTVDGVTFINPITSCYIKDADYGRVLTDILVYNYQGYQVPILPALAKASVYRICTELSGNQSQIEQYLNDNIDRLSTYLGIKIEYELVNTSLRGTTYTADLNLNIENLGFSQFKINVEIIYE